MIQRKLQIDQKGLMLRRYIQSNIQAIRMQFISDVSTGSFIVTLAIIIGTVLVYRKVIRPYRQFKHYEKILKSQYKTNVTPFSIIGLGNYGRYRKDYQKYGDSQYSIKRQLREYQVGLSSFTGLVSLDFIDTELIKEFYQRQSEGYYVKFLENPFLNSMKNLIGNGLIFSEGNEWKMKKKIMSNVFNHEFIKSKVGLIARICQDKIEEVEATVTTESGEVKMDISNLFQRIFGNVVVKSFFGDIELNKLEGVELFTYVNAIFQGNTKRSTNLFAFLLGPKFHKYNLRQIDRQVKKRGEKFNQFARQTILAQLQLYEQNKDKENKGKEKFNGLIELLVRQNKVRRQKSEEKEETKDYYNIQDLIDEFTTFFMAGTDTTSNATSILIYLLAQHPHVQDKLRKEINQLFKSPLDINEITYDNLKKLTYFDDVFKETLRMYSPTAGIFPRLALKDHYIGKIPIKKGLIITLKIKSNHFKEEFYENPFEFNPDRWSKSDPLKIDPYSYFPFSSGQRVCIGQHLALLESKIAVICLLKRYGKITLEKPNFKKYMRTLYAAEQMTTTFEKQK